MTKSSPSPSRVAEQFVVRCPDGMRDQISAVAKGNNRSMNAEIVARLQQSLDQGGEIQTLTTGALIEELITRLGARVQIVVSPEAAAAAGISEGSEA